MVGGGHVRQEPGRLEREPRARRLELDVLAASVLVPAPLRLGVGGLRRMDVEVAVVDVDVPPEDVADERQDGRVVDEVEEDVVEPEEGEPVQRVAVRRLRAPDALDGCREPLECCRVEGVLDDDEPVLFEPVPQHVAIYGRERRAGPERPRAEPPPGSARDLR